MLLSESKEYESSTLKAGNPKQSGSHLVKRFSKENLKDLERSISEDIKKFPAFHLFSPTFLQFLSTVLFQIYFNGAELFRRYRAFIQAEQQADISKSNINFEFNRSTPAIHNRIQSSFIYQFEPVCFYSF